jgi:hypothetical protein
MTKRRMLGNCSPVSRNWHGPPGAVYEVCLYAAAPLKKISLEECVARCSNA